MNTRADPFREFNRLAQQFLAGDTPSHPAVMAMDAWSDGDAFVVEFDLPGVQHDAVDITVERNVLTVTAKRPDRDPDAEMLAAERPTGLFSRQLVLGDQVALERAKAEYDAGVLRLSIPVTEKPRPARSRSSAIASQPRSPAELVTGPQPR